MKIFTTYIKQSVAAVFALLVGFQSYGQAEITDVTIAESTVESISINSASGTVSITIGYFGGCTAQSCATDALTPTFTLSSGASISPASGVTQNFTDGAVSYTVTGSDPLSPPQKTWLVSVVEGEIPCNGQDITSFTIPNQVGTSVIDNSANTVSVTMPAGTDVSALVPTFSSEGSTSPSSGSAQNFSSPVSYSVSDFSCFDSKTWTVTVNVLKAQNSSFQETIIAQGLGTPLDIETADIDNDGDYDFVVISADNQINLLINDGSANYTKVLVSSQFSSLSDLEVADLDKDGDIDLVVCGLSNLVVFRNLGSQSFSLIQNSAFSGSTGVNIGLGDINGDGDIDLISSSSSALQLSVWTNTGSGTFSSPVAVSTSVSTELKVVDFDQDGDQDIVAGFDGKLSWFQNSGAGSFVENVILASQGVAYIDVADLDNDNDYDIVGRNFSNTEFFSLINQGSQSFTQNTLANNSITITDIEIGNLDGQNGLDIVVISENNSQAYMYENDGQNNFTSYSFGTSVSLTALDVFNYNNSGYDDIVISNSTTAIAGFTNSTPVSTDLVAQYDFSGDFDDNSGNGNVGTGFGALPSAADRFGNTNEAFSFNGTSQYVTAANISGTPQITVSSWFKTSADYSSNYANFIEIAGGVGLGIDVNNNAVVSMQLGASNFVTVTSSDRVNDDFWHLATGTFDGSAMILYLDGVEVGRNETFSGDISYFNEPTSLNIGYTVINGADRFFEGTLDDLDFYNGAIDSTEVAALYSTGNFSSPITKMSAATLTVTDGFFSDSGGTGANYSDNENITTTLVTGIPGEGIVLGFTSYDTEFEYDYLYVYDGLDANAPLIDTYNGNATDGGNIPQTVVATNVDGALTLVFTSDEAVTAPGWLATISTQALPLPELVAQYDMAGNGNDATGNGNDFTFNNALDRIDRFGNEASAYNFDNVSQNYLAAADNWQFAVGNNTDFAISGWFRADQTSGVLFDKSDGSVGYIAQILTGGQLQFFMVQGATSAFVETTTVWNDDLWHHFVMQVDRDLDIQIYVDGVADRFDPLNTTGINPDTQEDFLIGVAGGVNNANLNTYITADLDDFKIYSRLLSAEEIYALYDEGGWNSQQAQVASINFNGADYSDALSDFDTGTPSGAPVFSDDRFGFVSSALGLDGLDDYVSFSSSTDASLLLETIGTASVWVNPSSLPAAGSFSNILQFSNGVNSYLFDLYLDSNGFPIVSVEDSVSTVVMDFSGAVIPLNDWTHLAVRWDATSVYLFVDGRFDSFGTTNLEPTSSTGVNLIVGRDDLSADSYFDGSIDDISFYIEGLSDAEINDIYRINDWPLQNVSAVSLSISEGSPSSGGTTIEVDMSQNNLQGNQYWDLIREFITAETFTFQVSEGTKIRVYGESGAADLIADLDGDAITIPEDGLYNIRYNVVSNEYHVYKINSVGLLGSARTGDDTGWLDPDDNLLLSGTTSGVYYLHDIDLFDGAWKLRANDEWDVLNWGDDEVSPDGTLELFGGNIPVLAGTYDVVADLINNTYTITDALGTASFSNVYPLSSSSIQLTWDDVVNETGYKIWRTETYPGGSYELVAELAANTTDYQDTGLPVGSFYLYYIETFNDANFKESNLSTVSTFSNTTATKSQHFNLFGGAGNDYGRTIAAEADGSYHIAGTYDGSIAIGPNTLTANATGMYFATLDENHNVTGSLGLDPFDDLASIGDFGVEDMVIAPDGNIYVTGGMRGVFNGSGSYQATSDEREYNLFLAKFNNNSLIDFRVISTTDYSSGFGLEVDQFSNVYLAGQFNGDFTFGGASYSKTGATLMKINQDGSDAWLVNGSATDGNGLGRAYGVAYDQNSSQVYVVGRINNDTDFGGTLLSGNGYEAFIATFDSNGTFARATAISSDGTDVAFDVVLDEASDPVVSGSFSGASLTIGNNTYTNPSGLTELFLIKYTQLGDVLWSLNGSSTLREYTLSLASHGANVYLSGYTDGQTTSFGSTTIENGEVFIASVGSDGTVNWTETIEGDGLGSDIDALNGLVYLTGRVKNRINQAGTIYDTNSGSSDAFVSIYNPNQLAAGLVGYYTFDNGSVADQSGNGNDGVAVNNPLFSIDRFGFANSAFEPEDNGTFIEIDNGGTWEMDGEFTQAAWIRPNNFNDSNFINHIIDGDDAFGVRANPSDEQWSQLLFHYNTPADVFLTIETENIIPRNQYTFVAVSVDANNALRMFVNGEQVSIKFDTEPNFESAIVIDRNDDDNPVFKLSGFEGISEFNGDIDDVRIYTGLSLDEAALLAIYQEEVSGGADRLVADYAFDFGDLLDISGNQFNNVTYRDVNGNVVSPFLDAGVDGAADGALSFNNDGTFVEVFHERSINLDRNFTVNVWVNPYALPEAGLLGDIIFQDGAAARLLYSPEGRLFYHYDHVNQTQDIVATSATMTSNQWQMITYSIENSDRMKIFHNGTLVAEEFLTDQVFGLSDRFTIGQNDFCDCDGDRYLNAAVDDLSVYQRVLTDQEIAEIYLQSDDRLFAFYPFNGNSVDESGNGFDATANGSPTLSLDRFDNDGLAYSFNGSSDYLTVPSVSGPLNATASLWFNTSADYSAGFVNMVELNGGIGLGINGLNQASIAMQLAPDEFAVLTSDQPVNDGKWHFLAATYNGASLVLYMDGVEIGRNEEYTGNILYLFEPTDLNIGLSASTSSYFSGSLDEIRLYQAALSATEIESVYNAEKPVNNLLAEYNFSGNLFDESGNGKDITVNNAAFGLDRNGFADNAIFLNGTQNLQGPPVVIETLTQASFVGWINPQNISKGTQVIAEQRTSANQSWQWELNPGGNLYYSHWQDDGVEYVSSTANGGVFPITQNGQWYHVAVVWTGNEAIHYVDGQEVYQEQLGGTISANASTTYFGSAENAAEGLEGSIDELKFYRIALTSTEIFDIFQNESTRAPEAPSNPSVLVFGPDAVQVRWADNSDNETSFDVTVLQSGTVISSTPVIADRTDLIVTGLQTDIEYEIYVEAVNGIGKSSSTASVFAIPILLPDPAVTVFPAIFSLDESIDITVDVNRLYPPGVFTASSILYLHSGLIEPGFENRGGWAAAPDNSLVTDNGVGQMTSNGDGTFTITIADPRTYYGVDASFVASQIAMLFRGADGTEVARGAWNATTNTGDIFIDVFDATNISRPFGKSAAFNGAQSLETQQPFNPDAWATQSQFTVEYWMNIASFPAEEDENYIFERFTNGLEGLAFRSGLFTSGGVTVLETWFEDGVTISGENISTIQLDDSYLASWVHVATTYDGSNVTVYLNGEQALTQNVTIAYPTVAGLDETLLIGDLFSGRLDEIRFWNTVLTSDAIKSSLGSILSGNEIGLQGYWRFEEVLDAADGLGTYSPDLTVNDNRLYGEAAVPSGQPDLSGGVLTVNGIGVNDSPSLFLQGQQNRVIVEVTNDSPAEAEAVGQARVLLVFSEDLFFDNFDIRVGSQVVNLNIPVGGTPQNIQFDFTLPVTIPSGDYQLFSLIDFDDQIDELDEENNDFAYQVSASNLQPLDAVTNLSNSSSSFTSLSFSWNPVTDANNYVYQLASDQGFANVVNSGSTASTTVEITGLELNTAYFFRVRAQNTLDGRETDYLLTSASTNEDITDPVVASISPGNSDVSAGDAVEITVTVTDNFAIDYVEFYKRTAGTADFSSPQVEMATETSGSVSFVFNLQATDFDNIGAVVAVQAFDRAGRSSGISQSVSYTIQANPNDEIPVSSTEKPAPGSGVTAYSIFAFPFQSKSLGLVFTAPADPAVWVVREYTGSGTSPYRTPSSLTAGRGYWFLSDDPTVFPSSFSGVSSPSLVNGAYEIALTGGWNMIGNPSNLGAMDWTDVINYNIANNPDITSASDISQLYKYTGTGATNGYTTANSLNRFEGAFVESNVGAVTLLVPATALTGARVDDALAAPRDYLRISGGWEFVMDMQVEGQASYGIAGFGAHPDASDGTDNFDLSTPILFDEFIRAEFNENELGGKQIARSIHQVKGNDVWEVSINSHVRSGAIMEIGFNGFVDLESGERLVMQDLQTGKILDVSTGMKHTIRYAPGYELRFIKGTATFIDEESQIDRLVVNELYPNPSSGIFNLDVVIPVSEQASDMLVEVSDLSGKKVYSRDYQNAPSGAVTLPLDLRGLSLRSGLYFVEISYIDSSTQKLYKKITKKGYLISDN